MSHNTHSAMVLAATLFGFGGLACSTSMADRTTFAHDAKDALAANDTRVVESARLLGMDWLIGRLADRRLVFVGERHDRYADHLNQLAIIQGLVARGKRLAIGMECFQQPFQGALDDYVAGRIDEVELLRRTQYFDRWRFDYRLYRPILRYARAHKIPLIALNLPAELTGKVGALGIDGLDAADRTSIPAEIDRGDPAYRDRLRAVFDQHPGAEHRNFEHFLVVQLLWDEGMAERAAKYLKAHPDRTLVVLAGAGHLEYGQGIPQRLLRRVPAPAAVVLNGTDRALDREAADYFLFPASVELPASGLLGIQLDEDTPGEGVRVVGLGEGSGAKAAGMDEGDRILSIEGQPVARYADIRIALLDASPGQRLSVEVLRKRLVGGDQRLTLEVELH
ncbi:ChaN family lipoprotein [Thiorhodococcus fuscus]|uniref:ChaN family lipoprotein n=1 Tax=Thiorhodococcus fuscus TaxID=527200 RepID=A0ABW4Y2I4_9GAMM